MYRIRRVSGLHKGILNDDVPKGLFLEHFFMHLDAGGNVEWRRWKNE